MGRDSAVDGNFVMPDHPCLAKVEVGNEAPRLLLAQFGFALMRECGKVDADKAQIYKGEDWCCEGHRKLVQAEGDDLRG